MTKCEPHKALKTFARSKLTFDEKCAVHRVVWVLVLGTPLKLQLLGRLRVVRNSPPSAGDPRLPTLVSVCVCVMIKENLPTHTAGRLCLPRSEDHHRGRGIGLL